MEFNFSDLKQKSVINLSDGKNLGKVCDITVTFPENDFKGIVVTGCKGFRFSRQEQFISVKQIEKIGEDAILVKLSGGENPPHKPPQNCKPSCPPPPPPCPPCRPDRRSLDDYE